MEQVNVGGPSMAVIALKCPKIKVTLVDSDPKKIDSWNGPLNQLPVYEPGLKEIINKVRGKTYFSKDIGGNIEKARNHIVAVNTPTKLEGEGAGMAADLKYVVQSARDIYQNILIQTKLLSKNLLCLLEQ